MNSFWHQSSGESFLPSLKSSHCTGVLCSEPHTTWKRGLQPQRYWLLLFYFWRSFGRRHQVSSLHLKWPQLETLSTTHPSIPCCMGGRHPTSFCQGLIHGDVSSPWPCRKDGSVPAVWSELLQILSEVPSNPSRAMIQWSWLLNFLADYFPWF